MMSKSFNVGPITKGNDFTLNAGSNKVHLGITNTYNNEG